MLTLWMSLALAADPVVIAHRGAPAYLPEHTLAGKALAYGMRPDFIEQDLVMTADDVVIVLHDRYLDRVTDVATRFPGRARADGRFYAMDFTLAEIRTLEASTGFKPGPDGPEPLRPNRFPIGTSTFRIPTFEEEIELIAGLNRTLGHDVGLYPEIKSPAFHRAAGKDISMAVLQILKRHGYTQRTHRIHLQVFDHDELVRIHDELMPGLQMDLKLVQLMPVTEGGTLDEVKPAKRLAAIARVADGIGPWMGQLVDPASKPGALTQSTLVRDAHRLGLVVHPYTFRSDPDQIPGYAADFPALVRLFRDEVGVDGLFTDMPDQVRAVLDAK